MRGFARAKKEEILPDKIIMTDKEMKDILNSIAASVLSAHPDIGEILLVGIERRGADLARRLSRLLASDGARPSLASIDINLYRDDWTRLSGGVPHIGSSFMPLPPDGKTVLLVDDVLFSGRTIRAAMEAILDYGRPGRIELAALVDRGHRELPIAANYIGITVQTGKNQHIDVLLEERDGRDAVILREIAP